MLLCHRYQNQGCSRKIGSCLDNQPYHLVTTDADRVAKGLEPIYGAQRYAQTGDVGLQLNLTGPVQERTVKIKYPVPSISSSLMTLEVAADSLKFIQNYSPGQVRCIAALWCDCAVQLFCDARCVHIYECELFASLVTVGIITDSCSRTEHHFEVAFEDCCRPLPIFAWIFSTCV
jgi:Male gamete fusion factor